MEEKRIGIVPVTNFFENLKGRIKKVYVYTFITTIIIGIVTFWDALSNTLANWDYRLGQTAGYSLLVAQGKWMIPVERLINFGVYNITIKLFMLIVLVAVCACLVCYIYDVEKAVWGIVIGLIFVTFPSELSCMAYVDTNWPMVFIVLGTLLLLDRREKSIWRKIFGLVVLICGMGYYPPYIGFASSIFVIDCLLSLLFGDEPAKKIWLRGIRYIGYLLATGIVYYLSLKLVTAISGNALSDYKGINEIENVTFGGIISGILYCYKKVAALFLLDYSGSQSISVIIAYCLLNVVFVIELVILFWRKKRTLSEYFLLLFLLIVFPASIHLIAILGQGASTHWIMCYPFVMYPILVVVMAGKMEDLLRNTEDIKKVKKYILVQWGTFAIGVTLILNWVRVDNEGQLRMKVAYEGAYQTISNVIDDLYESDAYTKNIEVAVIQESVGWRDGQDLLSAYDKYTGVYNKDFLFYYDGIVAYWLSEYFGIENEFADTEAESEIKETKEYKAMPCYPESGYIREINDILVIKM